MGLIGDKETGRWEAKEKGWKGEVEKRRSGEKWEMRIEREEKGRSVECWVLRKWEKAKMWGGEVSVECWVLRKWERVNRWNGEVGESLSRPEISIYKIQYISVILYICGITEI